MESLHIFIYKSFYFFSQIRNWNDLDGDGFPDEGPDDTCLVDGVPTLKCLEVVTGNILFMSNAFILLVLFIMFLYGGYTYLTSLGNPEKIEQAKGTFKWAIIGMVVYLSSYLILSMIDVLFLGGEGDIFRLRIGD